MYKRSLLRRRLPMEIDINDDSLKVSGITALLNYFAEYNPKSRETTIDTDLAWQQVWLGQILANLLGFRPLAILWRSPCAVHCPEPMLTKI